MKTAFVTGGTGFVGLNLVKALRADGWDVIAAHRRSSDLKHLGATGARLVVADAVDAASLRSAMPAGVDCVFHVAASTAMWKGQNAEQTRTNVDGTRNMVEVALERGAKRFVHTSSIAAFGAHPGVAIDETTPSNAPGHWINYLRTKWLAEEEVRSGVARGLPAVILNPVNILGPWDFGGWSRMFVLIKKRRLPGVAPGSGAWCHIRDVVAAHLAAVVPGSLGECHLLGGPSARYADVAARAAELMGLPAPRSLPAWMLRVFGRASQWGSVFSKKAPDVTPEIAYLLGVDMPCGHAKATRELGYQAASMEEMIKDTYDWLLADGRI